MVREKVKGDVVDDVCHDVEVLLLGRFDCLCGVDLVGSSYLVLLDLQHVALEANNQDSFLLKAIHYALVLLLRSLLQVEAVGQRRLSGGELVDEENLPFGYKLTVAVPTVVTDEDLEPLLSIGVESLNKGHLFEDLEINGQSLFSRNADEDYLIRVVLAPSANQKVSRLCAGRLQINTVLDLCLHLVDLYLLKKAINVDLVGRESEDFVRVEEAIMEFLALERNELFPPFHQLH